MARLLRTMRGNGKYAGMNFEDVPRSFCRWCLENLPNMGEDLRYTCERHVAGTYSPEECEDYDPMDRRKAPPSYEDFEPRNDGFDYGKPPEREGYTIVTDPTDLSYRYVKNENLKYKAPVKPPPVDEKANRIAELEKENLEFRRKLSDMMQKFDRLQKDSSLTISWTETSNMSLRREVAELKQRLLNSIRPTVEKEEPTPTGERTKVKFPTLPRIGTVTRASLDLVIKAGRNALARKYHPDIILESQASEANEFMKTINMSADRLERVTDVAESLRR